MQLQTVVLCVVIFSVLPIQNTNGYKILVYVPRFVDTQIEYTGRLADVLVKAGHDVVAYITEFSSDVTIDGTKLARKMYGKRSSTLFPIEHFLKNTWTDELANPLTIFKVVKEMYSTEVDICSAQLNDRDTIEVLKKEKFDFAITDSMGICGLALFKEIGVDKYAVAFESDIAGDHFGVSNMPSYVPTQLSSYGDIMNYWERACNFGAYMLLKAMDIYLEHILETGFTKHTGRKIGLDKQIRKSSYAFVNSDELFQFPRLTSHKVVLIGGITTKKSVNLTEEYRTIIDRSEDGVVLISFGAKGMISAMPANIKQSFFEAFAAFPKITFIWEYELDDDVGKDVRNLHKMKQLAPVDLLGSQKVRVFISKCDQSNLMESAYSGVPLICIPLFIDQLVNAKLVEKHEIGITVDKYNITGDKIIAALRDVLTTSKYFERSRHLAAMLLDKPFSSEERFVKTVEHTIRYGPITNLDIAGDKLGIFQYFLIDIIAPIFLVVMTVIYINTKIMLCICRRLFRRTKQKKD